LLALGCPAAGFGSISSSGGGCGLTGCFNATGGQSANSSYVSLRGSGELRLEAGTIYETGDIVFHAAYARSDRRRYLERIQRLLGGEHAATAATTAATTATTAATAATTPRF
jgi:hypothetical protein